MRQAWSGRRCGMHRFCPTVPASILTILSSVYRIPSARPAPAGAIFKDERGRDMSRITPKMRYVIAIGAASALAVGMAGCSGSGGSGASSKTVVFSTWGSADELKRFKEFDADFMKRHPDITVKLQPVA